MNEIIEETPRKLYPDEIIVTQAELRRIKDIAWCEGRDAAAEVCIGGDQIHEAEIRALKSPYEEGEC